MNQDFIITFKFFKILKILKLIFSLNIHLQSVVFGCNDTQWRVFPHFRNKIFWNQLYLNIVYFKLISSQFSEEVIFHFLSRMTKCKPNLINHNLYKTRIIGYYKDFIQAFYNYLCHPSLSLPRIIEVLPYWVELEMLKTTHIWKLKFCIKHKKMIFYFIISPILYIQKYVDKNFTIA